MPAYSSGWGAYNPGSRRRVPSFRTTPAKWKPALRKSSGSPGRSALAAANRRKNFRSRPRTSAARPRITLSGSRPLCGSRRLRFRISGRRPGVRRGFGGRRRMYAGRERRDGQRRHVRPADRKKTSARAGNRPRKSFALHLSRRFGRRVFADAGRSLSRPRTLRSHFL